MTQTPPTTPTPKPSPRPEIAIAPEIQGWLLANTIPFDTSAPDNGFDDLMPLKEIIGDARIVALGEATHGTHEFFQMKHRLVEFLIQEMDFSLFAIEAGWTEAQLVDEYVQTGAGNAAQVLDGLGYWVWNTQELLDLIEWMRTHNENPGEAPAITFNGFDMQMPARPMDNVIAYVERVGPNAADEMETYYGCFRQHGDLDYYDRSIEIKRECRDGLQAVYDHLLAHQVTYEAASSPQEFAEALHNARIVLQSEAFGALDPDREGEKYSVRDQAMAENVAWLLEQTGPIGFRLLKGTLHHEFHSCDRAFQYAKLNRCALLVQGGT